MTPTPEIDPADLATWPTARRLVRLAAQERRDALIGLGCALTYGLISITIPLIISFAIDRAILAHSEPLWPLMAATVVLATIRMLINFLRRSATSRMGIHVEARLREQLCAAYLRFPQAFYDRHPTGQVLSRATNDLAPLRQFVGWGLVQGVQSLIMTVGATIAMLIVDPLLAACSMLALPGMGWVTWRYGRAVIPVSRQVQQLKADVTESANEVVVGIEMVQAFGREPEVRDRFAQRAQALADAVVGQAAVERRYVPVLGLLPAISISLVLLIGGRQVIDGSLSIGQFMLFVQLLVILAWPLEALGLVVDLGQRALAAAGRCFAWLEGVAPLPDPSVPRRLPPGSLRLELSGVHYRYARSKEVLRGVDLTLSPGELTALVGPTGAGKSTLLHLLPRLYDPTSGSIRLGGIDLRDLSASDLRRDVALVTQEPILFSASLGENVAAARPEATTAEVQAACDQAGVSAFADELPDGQATLIGERGVKLSGGQRQRLALARALLLGARVVVLDDPLSAVDQETEQALIEQLRTVLADRTAIVAAQRLSTVLMADRAAVLEAGRVVERGHPAELLAAPSRFAALFAAELVDA